MEIEQFSRGGSLKESEGLVLGDGGVFPKLVLEECFRFQQRGGETSRQEQKKNKYERTGQPK